jgi:cephalosporin hydroxylase
MLTPFAACCKSGLNGTEGAAPGGPAVDDAAEDWAMLGRRVRTRTEWWVQMTDETREQGLPLSRTRAQRAALSKRDALSKSYRAAVTNYFVNPDLERFEAFEVRDSRSAIVDRELQKIVQSAKYRRHGKAGVTWRGVPILKDPYDMVLYPMLLWELRPATIIELGAFVGGSALWLADLASAFGMQTRTFSIEREIDRVQVNDPRIEFIEADLDLIADGFPVPMADLPHPLLVIEDAHVNLVTVLTHVDRFTRSGDYLIVEDTLSPIKYGEFQEFMLHHGSRYRVDTNYTDNFGYNGTWCWNSVLKCVADY